MLRCLCFIGPCLVNWPSGLVVAAAPAHSAVLPSSPSSIHGSLSAYDRCLPMVCLIFVLSAVPRSAACCLETPISLSHSWPTAVFPLACLLLIHYRARAILPGHRLHGLPSRIFHFPSAAPLSTLRWHLLLLLHLTQGTAAVAARCESDL